MLTPQCLTVLEIYEEKSIFKFVGHKIAKGLGSYVVIIYLLHKIAVYDINQERNVFKMNLLCL
jgi:hypothetical protein